MTLTVGSHCAGAGMLDLALASLLDVRQVWHNEVDSGAAKVLATHWPDVPNLGDITTVDWETVEYADVQCGGIPCQGWSLAGKRKGSLDERDLWPVRKMAANGTRRRGALDAIAVQRPRLFVFENVPGLLTAEDGLPFGQILTDLDTLGYAVSWTVVGACRVGACHHRHRLFLAAVPAELVADTDRPDLPPSSWRTPTGWQPCAGTLFGDTQVSWPQAGLVVDGHAWPLPADPCGTAGVVTMLPTPTARVGGDRGTPNAETAARRMFEEGRRNLEDAVALLPTPRTSDVRGVGAHGDGGLDLRTAVSMLPTPTPTARDATRGAGWGDQPGRPLSEVIALLPTPLASDADGGPGRCNNRGEPKLTGALLPTPRASDAAKGGPNQRGSSGDLMLPAAVQPGRFGDYEAAVRRQEAAFGILAPEPTEPGRLGKPRLAAAFPEFMIGLPRGFVTDHVSRNEAIRIAGNGVVWQACAYALTLLPTFRAFVASTTDPAEVAA